MLCSGCSISILDLQECELKPSVYQALALNTVSNTIMPNGIMLNLTCAVN